MPLHDHGPASHGDIRLGQSRGAVRAAWVPARTPVNTATWEGEAPSEPHGFGSHREGEAPSEPHGFGSHREGEAPSEPHLASSQAAYLPRQYIQLTLKWPIVASRS